MNYQILLSGMIERDQSAILRPISVLFGYIMNFFFEIACFFSINNSLGVSIILVTLVIRVVMFPLSIKTQRSTAKMAELQPEVNKIRAKYENLKDRESQAKMSQEIQTLYSKNNASMFGGCLPMFIQMPIFFALNFIMRQSFLFINRLGELYTEISETLYSIPNRFNVLVPQAAPRIPENMQPFDISLPENLNRVINKFTYEDWEIIMNSPEVTAAPLTVQNHLTGLLQTKESIELFFGINLLQNAGTAFPGVLIPIFSALFMFLSSHLMNRRQKSTDPQQKNMQRVMTIFFPLLIGWTTINFPAGVGLYWTVSNIFQVIQQLIMDKFYHPKDKAANNKDDKVIKVIPEKKEKTPRTKSN